jgi:SAM-dependent methyltransferase
MTGRRPAGTVGHHGRVPGIYDQPEFYAAACAYRDVRPEVDALLRWFAKHRGPGAHELRSVLELAAGPAEHAREMARRGLAATALDLSPAMCAYARDRAAATAGAASVTVVEADMRDFRLAHRFDLAITMLNSLCHLLTLDDLIRHLASVACHLAGGGVYVAELAHPADFLTPERRTSTEWSSQVDGGAVSVRWGGRNDKVDPITQVTREHVSVTLSKPDGSVRTVTDVVSNRFWTATELTAAIRLAGGFTVAASYGDFDTDSAVDAPDAWRMIMVLRRDSAPAGSAPAGSGAADSASASSASASLADSGPRPTATNTPASTSATPRS